MEEEEENSNSAASVKRIHVSTGNTPHKTKKGRAINNGEQTSRVRRTLISAGIRKSPKQLKFSPVKRNGPWSPEETRALVEFVALHKDLQSTEKEWPAMQASNSYWTKAAEFIRDTVETPYTRKGSSVRKQILTFLKQKFATVEDAEAQYGLNVDHYLGSPYFKDKENRNDQQGVETPRSSKPSLRSLNKAEMFQLFSDIIVKLAPVEVTSVLLSYLRGLKSLNEIVTTVTTLLHSFTTTKKQEIADSLFSSIATDLKLDSNPHGFVTLSLAAMNRLQQNGKNNLVFKFSQAIAGTRSDAKTPLIELNRMPFGLIEYAIEFFTCTSVHQIRISEDYRLWLQTMTTEFPSRFHRLFAGPMWSGVEQKDVGNPEKARTNIPAPSLVSNWRHNNKENLKFTAAPGFQPSALDELKKANPDGRFWLKLDSTDIKEGLMESMKGKWNGDVDMLDGRLEKLREEYEARLLTLKQTTMRNVNPSSISEVINDLKGDAAFLSSGLEKARRKYKEKYEKRNTPEELLKCLSWEVVEYHNLLAQAQELQCKYQEAFPESDETGIIEQPLMKQLEMEGKTYLRNVFKKRRVAADHVLVWMLSDEKRNSKPYALPVGYIPCNTLRDQHVRDLNAPLKQEMKNRGLKLTGVTTDGEYCTLRSQGETRPLHLWQLIHDAKESVKKMKKETLLSMLLMVAVDAYGKPVVERPCEFIPDEMIMALHQLRTRGMSLEDAITNIRGKLVPDGYIPYPFRTNNPETLLDKLRSIAATYQFRHIVQYWKDRGIDFSLYMYVPEVDPITQEIRHDRSDHNHVLKRIGKSTREGHNTSINFDAFDAALKDPQSGLTHAALVGLRKQSVKDAERLLSVHVVKSMRDQGYHNDAKYVEVICNWHAASDGRGLTQLQRCRYNYQMMDYILDELMPWHKENHDFSRIDVNRPWEYVCGFSRETLVEITTNIESQEYRRRENGLIGYPEHPRAGGTDDLENFFSIIHRLLGTIFTLKQFRDVWNQVVREFTKKMDSNLPFYYHTLNDRYTNDALPSFDACPNFNEDQVELRTHPLRLHRLHLNQREDSSIFAAGRNFLPVRNWTTIRSRVHRPEAGLPPLPNQLQNPTN